MARRGALRAYIIFWCQGTYDSGGKGTGELSKVEQQMNKRFQCYNFGYNFAYSSCFILS